MSRSRERRPQSGVSTSEPAVMSHQVAEETEGTIRQPRPLMRSSREVLTAMGLYPR